MSMPQKSINDIRKTLQFLHPDGSVFEVCCIGPKRRKSILWSGEYAQGTPPIISGWFDNITDALNIINELDDVEVPAGIFVSLNPCLAALTARANNRLKPAVKRTCDTDIQRIRHLLIDIDPKRPSGVSATDQEKGAALGVAYSINMDLLKCGGPKPLVADSGNGFHLIYKIDLPNDPASIDLIKGVLTALDRNYSTDVVSVDTAVFNPSRISKIYGTMARKGDSTADRPHRKSGIISLPESPQPVPVDLLRSIADSGGRDDPKANPASIKKSAHQLDVAAYLTRYGIQVIKSKRNGDSTLYVLRQCIFNPDHEPGEAAIGQSADGKLFYQCFHNSCQGRTWHEARKIISGDAPLFIVREDHHRNTIHQTDGLDDYSSSDWDLARELFPRIEFPWRVFPEEISTSLQQLARSHATSPLSLPGAAIAIFSSLLGATACVSPKPSWNEPLIFWFIDIRPSGSGKTPSARALCSVLYDAQKTADQRFKMQHEEWLAKGPKRRGPAPARPRSYFVTDLTLEGLRSTISGHGGLVVVLDELSAFLTGQNQYKSKGSDRESWLCLWDGNPFRVLRAGESYTVNGARVNICGGIQPQVWQRIFGSENGLYLCDGTVFRFLPTFEADRAYPLTAEPWADENRIIWEGMLSRAMAWADRSSQIENWRPSELCLNKEARDYFFIWRNRLYEQKSNLLDQLKGFIPKITSYALRLSGVLHCMMQFAEGGSPQENLTRTDIEKGIDAAMFYLGQIVDATLALHTQGDIVPFEMTPQTEKLAHTLEILRSEVDSGRLAVGHIWENFNNGLSNEQRMKSARAMGQFLRSNGLNISAGTHDANGKRAVKCLLWNDAVDRFLKQCLQNLQSLHPSEYQGVQSEDNGVQMSSKSGREDDSVSISQTSKNLPEQSLQAESLANRTSADIADFPDSASAKKSEWETVTV